MLDLKLATFIRSMVESSLRDWLKFVEKHVEQTKSILGSECNDKISSEAAEEVKDGDGGVVAVIDGVDDLGLDAAKKGVSEEKKDTDLPERVSPRLSPRSNSPPQRRNSPRGPSIKKGKRQLTLRRTELAFPYEVHAPLFRIELTVKNNEVVLEPSVGEIVSCFTDSVDTMVSNVQSVMSIDADAMSLLSIEPRRIFDICNGNPLMEDVDGTVLEAKTTLTDKISVAMERPVKLASFFNEYVWIVSEEVDNYLENIMLADPEPVFDDFQKEMKKIDDAMSDLSELSFKNENFGLVQVNTEKVKDLFISRALELRNALAGLICEQTRNRNIEVIGEYNNILERIAIKPANEKELAGLREFIDQSATTVEKLSGIIQSSRNLLALLEAYHCPVPLDDISLAWSALEYPPKIEHAGKEVEVQLEADKIRMMDRLSLQKDQFEKTVENLKTEVEEASTLKDYDDYEKLVEQVNTLMDNISAAKEKERL